MLKVKRSSQGLHLVLNDREHILSQPFLKAFGMAALIHVFLFTLFSIAPFRMIFYGYTYPPVYVKVESPFVKSNLLFEEKEISSKLPSPPPFSPRYVTTPYSIYGKKIDILEPQFNSTNFFLSREDEITEFPIFQPDLKKLSKKIKIILSEGLAQKELLEDGLKNTILPNINALEEWRVSYSVVLDEKRGKIFWFEPNEGNRELLIAQFAEKVLREISFLPNPKGFIVKGNVELHLSFK